MRKIENVEDLESLTPAERDEFLAEVSEPQQWCGTCFETKRQQMRVRMRVLVDELKALTAAYEKGEYDWSAS